jgi:diguanylate cyclase (GGDEF)-like protein
VGIDVTERRKLEEQLRQLSRCDGLTGIPNRRVFDETLEREFQRSFRSRLPLSLLLLDIDHFKGYNDSCGHQAGDDCLKRLAVVFEGACKRPTDLAARYGGEEFVLVLPDTDAEGAMEVAEKLRKEVERQNIPHPHSSVAQHVTVSIGVATTVLGSTEAPETLLAEADHALYTAKRMGRNRVFHILEAESNLDSADPNN